MPLHEARPHCKQRARSTSSAGEVVTDWKAYEECMADLGWVKQLPPGSGGSAPMGGGGPSARSRAARLGSASAARADRTAANLKRVSP